MFAKYPCSPLRTAPAYIDASVVTVYWCRCYWCLTSSALFNANIYLSFYLYTTMAQVSVEGGLVAGLGGLLRGLGTSGGHVLLMVFSLLQPVFILIVPPGSPGRNGRAAWVISDRLFAERERWMAQCNAAESLTATVCLNPPGCVQG